jgi:hypothetical protein
VTVGSVEELGDLAPIDVELVEPKRHPSTIAVVRRGSEAAVLAKGIEIEWGRCEVE